MKSPTLLKDPNKLRELIVEKLSLADVMIAYKVGFAFDPKLAPEVQYRCPIHGRDTKPSARLYNTTKSCYCWVCRKSWDVVSFVMAMEKMAYLETLRYLVNRFKIDTSSIPETPTLEFPVHTYKEETVQKITTKNAILSLKKKIPLDKYRAICTAYLMADYSLSTGAASLQCLNKIQDKILCLKLPQ